MLGIALGTGGGDTLGRLTLCDEDSRVPPPPTGPLPGPDDWGILDALCLFGLTLLVDMVLVSLDLDVSVHLGRGGTTGGKSDASLG